MLQRLGFKRFVYDWRAKDIPAFDAEFEAMKKHGVEVTGWWSPTDPRDPVLLKTLEVSEASQMLVFPNLFNVDLRTIAVVERVRTLVMRSRTVS